MKLHWIAALPMAAAFFLSPSPARAQGIIASQTPAVVILPSSLDSGKLSSGGMVVTQLTHSVKLPNGTELPKGTELIAIVSEDDMQRSDHYKLALRFTEARPKHGQSIPIKATILAVATQKMAVQNNPSAIEVAMHVPNDLHDKTDQVEERGITPGVDLYSRATSANSGVLVTDKDEIKLPKGSKMELALAPAQ